jgi:hypothetical protein
VSFSGSTRSLEVRGRRLARFIEALSNGDPMAIGFAALMVAVFIGWVVYKIKTGPKG